MKIVIIGAGIAGLSTYLFLKKHLPPGGRYQIKIYEAYDINKASSKNPTFNELETTDEPVFTPEAIGSAIGISKNGMSVIRRLDASDRILTQIREKSHPIKAWQMSNSRGWHLHDVDFEKMKEKDQQKRDKSEENNGNAGDKFPDNILVSRQGMWEILRDVVLEQESSAISREKVTDVIIGTKDTPNLIKFADGKEEEEVDLVIGADGLRSVLRKCMFPKSEEKGQNKSPDYVTPHYEGLVGVGNFIPSSVLKEANQPPQTMTLVFGANGFWGHGYMTTAKSATDDLNEREPGPTGVFWSTFPCAVENPYPIPNSTPKPYAFDKEAALKDLMARHKNWKNPAVQKILEHVQTHGLAGFYPTWTTPELPDWQQNGRCVLVGDAAHALQPSSGQGACQALEDAESLALLLKHYISEADAVDGITETKAVAKSLQTYVQLRKPRLHEIHKRSQQMAGMKRELGFFQEMLAYLFIKLMPYIMPKNMNDELFNYNLPIEVEKAIRNAE